MDFTAPNEVNDFLSYMETIKGKSPATIKEYFYDLRLFLRYLKRSRKLTDEENFDKIDFLDMNIKHLKTVTLSELYSYMSFLSRERKNSSRTRARKVASIKSFYNYLFKKAKLIDVNPTIELETPKIIKRLPSFLNVEESRNLLDAVSGKHETRDYAIITLFLNCGLRLSELADISISKIKDSTLTVIGKGGKERTIYLNHACEISIKNYLAIRASVGVKDKDALFLSERKSRISVKTIQHIVKKFIRLSGLDPKKYSTHKLRHTAATLMYQHGNVDIRALQEILGHESISTTEIYTHVDNSQLRSAVDANPLSQVIKDSKDKKY
jgi:integrase/recombinase XerD